MLEKDCFLIGKTLKPYGYKGFVKILKEKPLDLDIQKIDFFLIDQNKILVPFFIESLKEINSNTLLLKFEKLDTKEQLEKILKKDVYVPLKWIIKSKNNQTNILDFIVFDHEKGVLGKVDYIDTQTAQKLIYVSSENHNFCFPMHEKFLLKVNIEKKIIDVKIPQELINLN
jgi:16S rRNA processing protein RimM|tara:strand:+ start:75 stop:587 length:513 start_codon:yes stop_codon:yes gene_type:complete